MVVTRAQRISGILLALEAMVLVVPIGGLGLFGLQLTDSVYSTVSVLLLLIGLAATLVLIVAFEFQGREAIVRAHGLLWLATWSGGGLVIALAIYGVPLGLPLLVPITHLSVEYLSSRIRR